LPAHELEFRLNLIRNPWQCMHKNTIDFYFLQHDIKSYYHSKIMIKFGDGTQSRYFPHPFVYQFAISSFLCCMICDSGILKLSRILMLLGIIKFSLMSILWPNWTSILKFGILFVLWCRCWNYACYFFCNLELSICKVFVFSLNAFSLDC